MKSRASRPMCASRFAVIFARHRESALRRPGSVRSAGIIAGK
jgi:hypothetical protein